MLKVGIRGEGGTGGTGDFGPRNRGGLGGPWCPPPRFFQNVSKTENFIKIKDEFSSQFF